MPGGSDSDSEGDSGHAAENRPNEQEDTNEASRLLIDVRAASEDNISAVTITNNQADNDLSSMNNQMVTSATVSRDLRSSSSRYGSISSMNVAPATSSNVHENAAYSGQDGSQSESDVVTIEPKSKKKVKRTKRDSNKSPENKETAKKIDEQSQPC